MPLGVSRKAVSEREELLGELYETQRLLRNANARFNEVSQPELIEQCVYEINALKARHAYYMRVLREVGDEW
ncbi:MAG: DUF2508 family protein [Oscillospiraceae bacterium]|jgi:hypothetical protein|nr:DUF2508 family protein [Oscillospiraceae bacterium]